MCEPSGAQRGVFSVLSPPTSSFGGPEPSAGTTQMSALRLPVATSVVVRTNATCRAVGRQLRIGDAHRAEQIVDGHGPRRERRRGRGAAAAGGRRGRALVIPTL